jgi:hypothetical protein
MNNENQSKENKSNYGDYLLRCLNNDIDIAQEELDLKRVKGDFLSSDPYYLHNGPFKKTVVKSFHITDENNKVHHYDISLFRFKRENQESSWGKEEVEKLSNNEIEKLKFFITSQDEFINKEVKEKYFKIFSSNSDKFNELLDEILKNKQFDFDNVNKEGINKIIEIAFNVYKGNNVVLPTKIYQKLSSERIDQRSLEIYEENLKEFRALINSDDSLETDMQNFLSDKVWFFGLDYFQSHRNSKPKFNSNLGKEYDFLLESFNQVYDIVELKGPNEYMFEIDAEGKRNNSFDNRMDYKFSNKFSRALHQVLSYMDEFENRFDHIKENQPSIKDFIYPKGSIVISKRNLFPEDGKNSLKYLHLINRQFANINILTYDDLADRAQIIIDFIKKIKD